MLVIFSISIRALLASFDASVEILTSFIRKVCQICLRYGDLRVQPLGYMN
jgi:hypothetical protein